MTLQFWHGFLAYLVPLFPLAYLWHLKTFKAAYDRLEIFRDQVIVPFGLLSMAMQAAFFSWVFPKLFTGASWVLNGLQFALDLRPARLVLYGPAGRCEIPDGFGRGLHET